jgi:hypothetical protein
MRQWNSSRLSLACGLAIAATCVGESPAPAQSPAVTPQKTEPKPTRPPTAGPGSISGVWMNAAFKDYRTGPPVGAKPNLRTANGEPVPLQPEAAKIVAQRLKDYDSGHPYAHNSTRCVTDGMPSATSTPPELPLEIIETPDQVVFLYEYFTIFRIIHLNAKHPEDPDPTYMGNAVAHWEGDSLVVDTIAVTDKTEVLSIIPHSEDLHIVERIHRTGPDTLENRVTIEDPKTFTKPWTIVNHFKRVPGAEVKEFVCDNSTNRNLPGADSSTGVQLQTSGN